MEVKDALMELAEAIKRLVNYRIRKYGINPKTGTNTLEGSELQQSLEVYPTSDGIELQIAQYWEYVALGWHRTGRFPGTMSKFVKNIDDWVRRKGIRLGNMTQAQMVYIIIRNIMNLGLRERPFMIYNTDGDLTEMIPELNDYMDKWFDTLFNAIMSEVDNYFNK